MKKKKNHFKITKMWQCPLRGCFVLNNLNTRTSRFVQNPEPETLSSILPKVLVFDEILFSMTPRGPQGSRLLFDFSITDSVIRNFILSLGQGPSPACSHLLLCPDTHASLTPALTCPQQEFSLWDNWFITQVTCVPQWSNPVLIKATQI